MDPFRERGERADDKATYFSYAALVRRKQKWLRVWRVLVPPFVALQAWGLAARFEAASWFSISLGLLAGAVVFLWMGRTFDVSAEPAEAEVRSSERARVASEPEPASESEPAEESLFVEDDRSRAERRS